MNIRFRDALFEAGFEGGPEFVPPQVLVCLCGNQKLFLGRVQLSQLLPFLVLFFQEVAMTDEHIVASLEVFLHDFFRFFCR